jgi:hypothetical protein
MSDTIGLMDAYRHKHFIFPARHSPAQSLVEIFSQTAVPRDHTASSLVLKRNPSPTRHIAGKNVYKLLGLHGSQSYKRPVTEHDKFDSEYERYVHIEKDSHIRCNGNCIWDTCLIIPLKNQSIRSDQIQP